MKSNIKKYIVLILAFVLSLSLASCSSEKENYEAKNTTPVVNNSQEVKQEESVINNSTNEVMEKTESNSVESEETMASWMYSEFSSEKLVNSSWNIVLFFHASWCPACKSADKNFASDKVPENLTVLKVNYDDSSDLKQKYWVTSQHTFVQVDKNWNMIKKWVWWRDFDDVVGRIDS